MAAKMKKPVAKKLDAPKVLGAKSVKVEANAKGEIRRVETKLAAPAKHSLKDLGEKPDGEPRDPALPADAKITCLMKENPSRAGTVALQGTRAVPDVQDRGRLAWEGPGP